MISPLKNILPLSLSRLESGVAIFHSPTSLVEYNRLNAVEVGTTLTQYNTGSLSGFDLSNPTALGKPTVLSNGILFDGVNDELSCNVTNFLHGYATWVTHYVINYTAGVVVLSASNGVNKFVSQNITNSNQPQIYINDGALNIKRSGVALTTGTYIITDIQDGVTGKILVNGVEVGSYDNNTLGAKTWSTVNTTKLSIGMIYLTANSFTALNYRYIAIEPYVNLATAQAQASTLATALTNNEL